MPRRPREDLPGSWHHVINRGIAKRPLFERREDMRFFLARLVRQIRLGRIEVHAYCLMTTHFHLLVCSPTGEMSEALRRAQNEHSRRFNRRSKRDGALIRGRFFSRPVDTLEYRRTLVCYIDNNPVRAGLVRSSADYEFCSASSYLGHSRPPWLSRDWVESEACSLSRSERFTPAAYRAAFSAEDPAQLAELCDLVEARMVSSTAHERREDLINFTPSQVRAWMERKARLADGHKPGQPLCSRSALRRALSESVERQGDWIVADGRKTFRGAELAWIGLLRDACSLSWQDIAVMEGGSVARVRRLGLSHRRFLLATPDHARRTAEIGQVAISRCIVFQGASRHSQDHPGTHSRSIRAPARPQSLCGTGLSKKC